MINNDNFSWDLIYTHVYDHFKEQDTLRNSIIVLFTTLTGIFYQFRAYDLYSNSLLFASGFILSLVMCRHKYYGEVYLITMKTILLLYPYNTKETTKSLIYDKANSVIENYCKKTSSWHDIFKKMITSADSLLLVTFSITNAFNLVRILLNYFTLSDFGILIISLIYILLIMILFNFLVIRKAKRTVPEDLTFINIF